MALCFTPFWRCELLGWALLLLSHRTVVGLASLRTLRLAAIAQADAVVPQCLLEDDDDDCPVSSTGRPLAAAWHAGICSLALLGGFWASNSSPG